MNFDINSEYFIIKNYSKNDIIKNEGEICDSIGIIISGNIYISNILNNYNEFIITKLKDNEMFGESLIFSKKNKYPGSVIASSSCKIAFLKKNKFLQLLSIDEDFKLYYLQFISNRFIEMQNRLKILSQPSISEMFLYYLKIELKKSDNNYVIVKSISDVAEYLNVPRPSLSRTISQLIDEGLIKRINKKYYLQ